MLLPQIPLSRLIKYAFICLICLFFSQSAWSQSITLNPSSQNISVCEDSISLSVNIFHSSASITNTKISIPNEDGWAYMDLSATVSGNAQIDSIRKDDSVHFFISNISSTASLNVLMESTCDAINASSYNFDQDVYATFYLSGGGTSNASASSYITVNSPFLVVAARNYPNPTIGDTIIRQTIIRNTGSLPFTGNFHFTYSSQLYAEIIGTGVRSTSNFQIDSKSDQIDGGSSTGSLEAFTLADSLIFTDTMVLKSCVVDSTQTFYTFDYGCESGNLCQNVGISPFIYSNIIDKAATITAYIEEFDRACFLSSDTMLIRYGVRNTGNITARDFLFSIYKLFNNTDYGKSPHIPEGGLKIFYNDQLVSPDSLIFSSLACGIDSTISYAAKSIAEFEPEDSILIEYKTVVCCGTNNRRYQYYQMRASSERQCTAGEFVHRNIQVRKTYEIDQFFENLTATIQIEPGDLDRTSDPVAFSIENTEAFFLDNVPPAGAVVNYPVNYFELLGTGKNAIFEVKLALDTGLLFVDNSMYMKTLPNAVFQHTWHPYEVEKIIGPNSLHGTGGMQDTIIARFALADFLYEKNIVNNNWRYDSLEFFFSDSKVHFELQGICPGKQPRTKIVETISLITDTTCSNICAAEIISAEAEVAIMCPGCETPGYITSVFDLTRRTIGLLDSNNNHFPDFPNTNIKADKDSIAIRRAIVGDTLDMYLKANLWQGSLTIDGLGIQMKNTIVQFLLADQLEIVGDLSCVYYDISRSRRDTVVIPSSYLTTNGTVLNFHIDSLEANGLVTAGSLEYFNGFDEFELFGKVIVSKNIGVAQEVVLSMSRVYASGLTFETAGRDAADQFAMNLPLDSSHKYWCEFQGDMTSLVRVVAAPHNGTAASNGNFMNMQFASIYSHVVSSSQYIRFLNNKYPITIGKQFDDSFPFEVREFVEFDSVIIEKPNGYELTAYHIRKSASSHDGALSPFFSIMDTVYQPALDVGSNSYITFPQSHFEDTTDMPDFNDPVSPSKRNVYRSNKVFNTDEENHPTVTYQLTPTNCAAIIGEKIPFNFRGVLSAYPLQEGRLVIEEDSLEAYLPEVKLTTEITSPTTIYLTDTVHSSSFRLINDHTKNPIIEENNPNNARYLVDVFDFVFARVIASPLVEDIQIRIAGTTHPSYIMDYDAPKDLFKLNKVKRGQGAHEYEVTYSYSCPMGVQNVTDSVVVITGWNCNGFPSDLATACQLDTNVFYIIPQAVGLDGVLSRSDNNLVCDTVSYALTLNSQGAGKMLNIKAQLDLANSTYTYVLGSAELEFQGSFTPISKDVNDYFNLDDISYFEDNGFDYLDGAAILHLDLAGQYSANVTETIKLNVEGESYCGDSIGFVRQLDLDPCIDESVFFKTTWQVGVLNSLDATVTIPTKGIGYNYTVDWGDGSPVTTHTGSAFHDYDQEPNFVPGFYQIKISGDFPTINFYSSGDRDKIVSIDQWGDIEWKSMSSSFYGCSNLVYKVTDPLDVPDLSQVTYMNNMFYAAPIFKSVPSDNGNFNNWDLSNVTHIGSMFRGAKEFNSNISNWDVDSIAGGGMVNLFLGATAFNQPIGSWNVTDKITSFQGVFQAASSFNQPLSNWNTSGATSLSGMFYGATSFNQDVSHFDVSNAVYLNGIFYSAYQFNNGDDHDESLSSPPVKPLSWNVSKCKYMFQMFAFTKFNQDISDWNTSSAVSMKQMFYKAPFNQAINYDVVNDYWDVSSVTDFTSMFGLASSFNKPIDNWIINSTAAVNMSGMFYGASIFNQDIGNWDVSKVTNMYSMFYYATKFDQDLSNWDVSDVTNMYSMFLGAKDFNQSLGDWKLSSITGNGTYNSMARMLNTTYISTSANEFGMNLSNYDLTLIGWATEAYNNSSSIADNVSMGAWNKAYCNADDATNHPIGNSGLSAIDYLTTHKGWDFGTTFTHFYDCAAFRLAAPKQTESLENKPFTVRYSIINQNIKINFEQPNGSENTMMHDIKLFDMSGRLIYQTAVSGKEANISSSAFSKGIYLLRVEAGQNVESKKVIIQ